MGRSKWGVVVAVIVGGSAGCGGAPGDGPDGNDPSPGIGPAALIAAPVDSNAILGFESPAGWTVTGGTATATSVRTQGVAALGVDAPKQLTFSATSAPVASTATALAGLGTPGATFLLDVFLPTQIGNVNNQGSLQLFVGAKSRSINNAYLGLVSFQGVRLGTYRTVRFTIPEPLRQKLTAAPFSDLTFQLLMTLPGKVSGTYRLDNLRARSFGTPVPGPGQSVDLVAQLTSGGVNTPGNVSFAAGVVQVPKSFHVKLGSAGTGTTRLVLGFGNGAFVTCTYGASLDGASYVLTSCTGGFLAGDLIGADHATLTIVSAGADGAKIRAQLALNPVGDLVGPGIIPPMPTWWGECVALQTPICQGSTCKVCDASSASQIVTEYFQLVAQNPPMGSTVKTPRGEFARRSGDGSPHNNLTGPPPPNDPPFDQEGHLNQGGDWDAYWRLQGSLSQTTDPNNYNNHNELSAALDAHAVLWGSDVDVAGISVEAFTDSGQITATGFTQQNSGGTLTLSLFGQTLSGGGSIPTGGSFNFNPSSSQNFDLPPIPIWIFSITLGLHAELGVNLSGNVNPMAIAAAFTPYAKVGAHIEGDINLGIASGGVSAEIDLLKVSTPFTGTASSLVSTAPTGSLNGCRFAVALDVNGKLELSTLGGEVDLEAEFGVCPFCYSDSWTLFSWDGVTLASQTLFDVEKVPSTSLDPSMCLVDLDVSIDSPTSSLNVPYGIPFTITSHAIRPPTLGAPQKPIDCGQANAYEGAYNWATTDANDRFADPVTGLAGPSTGCQPLVTFARDQSTRTVTLNVTDQFGEAGSRQVGFNIVAPPPGPNPFISAVSPATRDGVDNYNLSHGCYAPPTIHLKGGEFNGELPVTLNWSVIKPNVFYENDLGEGTTSTTTDINGTTVNTSIDFDPSSGDGTYTFALTSTDHAGYFNYKIITVHVFGNPC